MNRTCIELTAIYDDGTVERVSGAALAEWWDEAVDHNGECEPWDDLEWQTSKPLRKVTEVEGHVEDWDDDPYISVAPGVKVKLVDVLPDETRKDCTRYRFRFVCEAMKVEETKAP